MELAGGLKPETRMSSLNFGANPFNKAMKCMFDVGLVGAFCSPRAAQVTGGFVQQLGASRRFDSNVLGSLLRLLGEAKNIWVKTTNVAFVSPRAELLSGCESRLVRPAENQQGHFLKMERSFYLMIKRMFI